MNLSSVVGHAWAVMHELSSSTGYAWVVTREDLVDINLRI